jgi:uncharacterized membrane protein YebE (DUF533 family)
MGQCLPQCGEEHRGEPVGAGATGSSQPALRWRWHSSRVLQAIFEAARRFGLTEDEAWWAIDESLSEVGRDATVSEYIDELTGVLAQRILSKQRRVPSEELP